MLNVSVVTYHTPLDELRECLSTLSETDIVDNIYIVDNSHDVTIRALVADFGKAIYIPSDNIGYGAAHNIAMRNSIAKDADYHLVLNSDIEFSADDLGLLIDFMDSHPDTGMCHPRILNSDGTDQFTVRMLPTPLNLIARRFLPKWMFRTRNDEYLLKHIDHSKAFNAPYHQGSFMLIRCKVLSECGLFDERFFLYPEDIDFTRRVHEKYRTMYVPLMRVTHNHRAESYHSLKMTLLHCRNMISYFNKWGWFYDNGRKQFNKPLRKKNMANL